MSPHKSEASGKTTDRENWISYEAKTFIWLVFVKAMDAQDSRNTVSDKNLCAAEIHVIIPDRHDTLKNVNGTPRLFSIGVKQSTMDIIENHQSIDTRPVSKQKETILFHGKPARSGRVAKQVVCLHAL